MDEPFAALDAQTREIMQAELMRICRAKPARPCCSSPTRSTRRSTSPIAFVFTVRPGRLKQEIPIDLPKPRDLNVKRTPAFADYTARIWSLIEAEVKEAIKIEVEAVSQQQ